MTPTWPVPTVAITAAPRPIASQVTVVITTSPTPSAPSPELIEAVLDSYRIHCPPLTTCPVLVVFDGYDHVAPRAKLKRGQVTEGHAAVYSEYVANVKALLLARYYGDACNAPTFVLSTDEAEFGFARSGPCNVDFSIAASPDGLVTFVEPTKRLGFALAVRTALRRIATPYVWIQQHDWALLHAIPLAALLGVMDARGDDPDAPVKYVTFPSTRMYAYAVSPHVSSFPALRGLTRSLRTRFLVGSGSVSVAGEAEAKEAAAASEVPLTPLFLWHDKPHLVSTAHYLGRVFPTRLAVPRGAFIEDTVGHRARAQMKEGRWARWATWLYYPDEGRRLCLRHLSGRTFKGKEWTRLEREQGLARGAAVTAERGGGGLARVGSDDEVFLEDEVDEWDDGL
jgi:hypothetical protein